MFDCRGGRAGGGRGCFGWAGQTPANTTRKCSPSHVWHILAHFHAEGWKKAGGSSVGQRQRHCVVSSSRHNVPKAMGSAPIVAANYVNYPQVTAAGNSVLQMNSGSSLRVSPGRSLGSLIKCGDGVGAPELGMLLWRGSLCSRDSGEGVRSFGGDAQSDWRGVLVKGMPCSNVLVL